MVELDGLDLRRALLADSYGYTTEASLELRKALAAYLPGGRLPDHVVVMHGGRFGQASSDGIPTIDSTLLSSVADGARGNPAIMGMVRQPALHGDSLATFAKAHINENYPEGDELEVNYDDARHILGELLRSAYAYTAATEQGYTVVLLNRRTEGLPPSVNQLIPQFAANLSNPLPRDPETGLVLHKPDGRIGAVEYELARNVGQSGKDEATSVIGIHPRSAHLGSEAPGLEDSVREAGGYITRVEGRAEFLALVATSRANDLTVQLSRLAARVSLFEAREPTQEALAAAIDSARGSLSPAAAPKRTAATSTPEGGMRQGPRVHRGK